MEQIIKTEMPVPHSIVACAVIAKEAWDLQQEYEMAKDDVNSRSAANKIRVVKAMMEGQIYSVIHPIRSMKDANLILMHPFDVTLDDFKNPLTKLTAEIQWPIVQVQKKMYELRETYWMKAYENFKSFHKQQGREFPKVFKDWITYFKAVDDLLWLNGSVKGIQKQTRDMELEQLKRTLSVVLPVMLTIAGTAISLSFDLASIATSNVGPQLYRVEYSDGRVVYEHR
jgi:hypothetical protein